MKLHDEFPIEPLSDATWQRIERATFAELDRRAKLRAPVASRRPPRALVVGGLALAAVGLLIASRLTRLGQIDQPRNLIADARATDTQLGDVAIHLEAHTELELPDRLRPSSSVIIRRGAARFSVTPRGRRPPFAVQAGNVRVEVVGTRFRVERRGDTAHVTTYEGVVRVLAAGTRSLVFPGQHWPAQASPVRASAASAVPAVSSQRALETTSARAPAPPASRSAAQAKSLERSERRRGGVFARASSLERSDPEQALQAYRSLARGSDAWAANALYAMARLQIERGRPEEARQLAQSYLARFPGGDNASDARLLLADSARSPSSN